MTGFLTDWPVLYWKLLFSQIFMEKEVELVRFVKFPDIGERRFQGKSVWFSAGLDIFPGWNLQRLQLLKPFANVLFHFDIYSALSPFLLQVKVIITIQLPFVSLE